MDNIRYQVFVSSTYEDLVEERKQVTQAILECDCFPAGMELFPASNESQWDFIKQVIDESDIYLVIIAGRYGSIDEDKHISYTEMEFDYAMSTNKPIIVLIHNNISNLPAKNVETTVGGQKLLKAFTAKAKKGRVVKFWSNKDNIESAVLASLNQIKGRLPNCGWIKANAEQSSNSNSIDKKTIVANDRLSKELQDKEKELNNILDKHQKLKEELSETLKEKSEIEKKLIAREKALEKAQQEINTLYKTTKVNSDSLTNELSKAKARINELEKEIISYKWSNNNRAQYNASDNSNNKASMYIDNSDFWIRFTNNFLRNKYTLKNGMWDFEMRKDLAKYMNDNLITFFSIYNDLQKWNSIVTKATVKKSQFSKLSAQDQISYLKGVSFNNLLSDKILQNKRTLQDKVDTFFPHYLFVLITQENDCKSSAVADVVSEVKTNMNIICNKLVAYVI